MPPLRRALALLLTATFAVAAVLASGCGKVTADRSAISKNLGLAYGAYLTYVAEPTASGKLGPATAKNDPAAARAALAGRYATRAVEAARAEAAPDEQLATFAQRTAAAGASLNAIAQVLETGRPNRTLVAGGTATLESLLATARDQGLTISRQRVTPDQLRSPPAA